VLLVTVRLQLLQGIMVVQVVLVMLQQTSEAVVELVQVSQGTVNLVLKLLLVLEQMVVVLGVQVELKLQLEKMV
jgi:hypothetical protein